MTTEQIEAAIRDARAIVADGDAHGIKAKHSTDIHTRQVIERLISAALTAAGAARPAQAEWQPIETAPIDKTVDIWLAGEGRMTDCFLPSPGGSWRHIVGHDESESLGDAKPSHWYLVSPPSLYLKSEDSNGQ